MRKVALMLIGLLFHTSAFCAETPKGIGAIPIPPGLQDFPPRALEKLSAPSATSSLVLQIKQRRICRGIQATYDYEAWVESNGSRVGVDQIQLFFWRPLGPIGGQTITCNTTSWCPFTDRQFYTGNACTRSVFHACATSGGSRWCTTDSVLE